MPSSVRRLGSYETRGCVRPRTERPRDERDHVVGVWRPSGDAGGVPVTRGALGGVAAVALAIVLSCTRASANDCSITPCDRPSAAPEPRADPVASESDATTTSTATRGRIEIGGAYKRLYDIPFYGVDATLGLGGVYEHFAFFVEAGVFAGRSENGLATQQLHLSVAPEARLDRWSLGIELRLSHLWIHRVTTQDTITNAGLGVRPYVAADLVRWEGDRAIVASLGLDADLYASVLWGPSLRVSARF
jgi:hypothetical protein